MAQHFLLSSAAKTLSLMDIMAMTDDAAWRIMREARWPETEGEPVCPRCGADACWSIRSRRQFRCKACRHTFSVTSGTVFDGRKLPIRTYLLAVLIFANAAKGLSALQLSKDVGMHYRTAYRLGQLLRQSLLSTRDESPMQGDVEVDGAYTGSYVRPANRKQDREDRRSADLPNKRCVLVLRQRGERGAVRTLTDVVRSETTEEIVDFVTGGTSARTTIHADEAPAYDALAAWYDIKRVNHSVEYSGENGENTNQAESYFSRFRRLQIGQVHHVAPEYLREYAGEIAYREDTRRWSNGDIFRDVIARAFRTAVPAAWRNYGRRASCSGASGLAVAA